MNSQFRLRAASAAILLASLGAGFVATPASAAATVVARSSSQLGALLHRFEVTVNHEGTWPGIVYRVYGVPGANVIVDLPGMGQVDLPETQPGTYEAAMRLKRRSPNLYPA